MLIQNNGKDSLLYTYTDNQGSLIALTDESGNIVERYAFDPWGARRNPDQWEQKDSRTKWITNRGYTGHEHLDAFGIINMNGRVYDPQTAMFFSPDSFVQAPDNWVNYNRYGYCLNNPLIYSDPSGYMFDAKSQSGYEEQFWQYLGSGCSYSQAISASQGGGGGGGGSSSSGHFQDVNDLTQVSTYSTNKDGTLTLLYTEIDVNVSREWVSGTYEDAMYSAVHPETDVNTTIRNAFNIKYSTSINVTYYANTKITNDLTNLKTITSDLKGKELSVSNGLYSQGIDGSYMIGNIGFNPTNGDFIINQSVTNPFSNTTYGLEIHVNANNLIENFMITVVEHPEMILEYVMESAN